MGRPCPLSGTLSCRILENKRYFQMGIFVHGSVLFRKTAGGAGPLGVGVLSSKSESLFLVSRVGCDIQVLGFWLAPHGAVAELAGC